MATAIHVNGAAVIGVGDQGTTGSLSTLGISESGPSINIEFFEEGVIADTGGPNIPVDVQKMGKMATITFALPIYDITVLTTRILSNQAGNAEGNLPELGGLMFTNNAGFRLTISSPIDAVPWRFYYCRVASVGLRPGTKYNIYEITINALPFIGGVNTSAANLYLYDHTAA